MPSNLVLAGGLPLVLASPLLILAQPSPWLLPYVVAAGIVFGEAEVFLWSDDSLPGGLGVCWGLALVTVIFFQLVLAVVVDSLLFPATAAVLPLVPGGGSYMHR